MGDNPAHAIFAQRSLNRPLRAGVVCVVHRCGHCIATGQTPSHGADLLGRWRDEGAGQDRRGQQRCRQLLTGLSLVRQHQRAATAASKFERRTGATTGLCTAKHSCGPHCRIDRSALARARAARFLLIY